MLEFVPLASSSSGCSYLVRHPQAAPLLVDCGVRFPLIQQALNFKVSGLAGCLVSHGHGDHCASIPDLLKAGVEVYSGEATWQKFQGGKHFSHHRANVLKDKDIVRIGEWLVMPFEVVHDYEQTFGFLIKFQGESLAYITDTAYVPVRFENLTILAIECNWGEGEIRENTASGSISSDRMRRTATTHMSIERLERMVKANELKGCREIWLLHLSDQNSNEDEFKERIQRLTGCEVHVAAKSAAGRF